MIHPLLLVFPSRIASVSFSEVYNEFISWNHHSSSLLRSLLSFSMILVAVFSDMYNTVSSAYFMNLEFVMTSARSLQ